MKLRYFGTDGIRGKVGGELMNPAFARRFGRALGAFLDKHVPNKPHCVMIGRDPRASGEYIEEEVCRGLDERGAHLYRLGVTPTPAVSMMVRDMEGDLGVMVSASHNPAGDNGLKLFDNRGLKFTEEAEAEIEGFIDAEEPGEAAAHAPLGHEYEGRDFYLNYMRSLLHEGCLRGWKLVVDCANGATAETTPAAFRHFGASLVTMATTPDGANINAGVGSEYPEEMAGLVRQVGARLGIAHDGDGDRVIFADEQGEILHGDETLGILALHALREGRLKGGQLVTTVQSNKGLDLAVEAAGGKVERVEVGDRNVLWRMLERGANLGGENSGHLLFLDYSVAGDGLLGAIQLVRVLLETGRTLSELRREIPLLPQVTANLRVRRKRPMEELTRLGEAMRAVEAELGGTGRLLVRYSGTEPKLRLLVEGTERAFIETALERLLNAAAADLEVVAGPD